MKIHEKVRENEIASPPVAGLASCESAEQVLPALENKRSPLGIMTTVALDPSTETGWAVLVGQEIRESGTELLATEDELRQQRREGKERTGDIRFTRFLHFLYRKTAVNVQRIVFEDVIFDVSQAQTQLWGSLRAAIWVVAERFGLTVSCVPVATLKVFAAGDGGANKLEMAQALTSALPAQYVTDSETGMLRRDGRLLDDNEVDAIWLARYTAAVDRGDESFLSVYQRKVARRAARRAKRIAARAQQKARNAARELLERKKRRELMDAIKAAGRCCGVFRKAVPYGKAICPKCGQSIRIPKSTGPLATRVIVGLALPPEAKTEDRPQCP